jgi:hypothetical protein
MVAAALEQANWVVSRLDQLGQLRTLAARAPPQSPADADNRDAT